MGVQVEVSQWLGQVAGILPFGYAFGAGMVSAVNPCGFALLPVYLTLYLGAEDSRFRDRSLFLRLMKAFWIALVVTSGFALLFGVVGAIVAAGGTFLMGVMPWIAVIVGLTLMLLGVWMFLGNTLSAHFFLGLAGKIGDPREMSVLGFFLFGVAFGATSLGCTLPIFLMVVGSSATAGDFAAGILQFLSYILGMGCVMQILTLGIAVVKEGVVVGALRRVLPYVQKVSALLLLVAGGYIIFYWLSSGLLLE
ncbi:MAG: cytochrome c biogenesis protein CcdA [Proteobacteria bacterium]|nr:cytochrome c biogenesis protein CcdA [Pseudomonadota bacterium]